MQTNNQNSEIIIFSDKENILEYYEILFEQNLLKVKLVIYNNEIDFNTIPKSNILVFDFYNIKNLKFIENKLSQNKKNKLIVIVPFAKNKLYESFDDIHIFDLILTKPVDTKILINEINNYINDIEFNITLEDKNAVLRDAINYNKSMISIYNLKGELYFGNQKFLQEFDLTYKNSYKETFADLNKNKKFTFDEIIFALTNESFLENEQLIKNHWYKFEYFKSTEGYITCVQTDITERKAREKKLEQSAIFFEHSNEGIVVTNKYNKIVSVNKAFCKITGFTKDEAIGNNPSLFKSGMHDKLFYEHMWESLKRRNIWQGEIWNKRKNGEIYPQWLSISRVISTIDENEYYLAIFTDITNLKEADKMIYFYANNDPLTELPNRMSFENSLNTIVDKCTTNKDKFAIFFIDIDNFKYINDTYGHDIGDEIIKSVGKRISESVREYDMVARIGGDEFTLIMNNIYSKKDVEKLAQKIIENVSKKIELNKKQFNITLSIGASIFPEHGKTKNELLKKADTAMYVVKSEGRNGFRIYNDSFAQDVERRFNIQNYLRDAIFKDEIFLNYQPFYDSTGTKIKGLEVLARWITSEMGFVSPAEFINYAESSDLIAPLSELIFEKSLHFARRIKNLVDDDFTLSINISGKYFYDYRFYERFINLSDKYDIKPTMIEFEITETHLMKNVDLAIEIINKMKEIGFKFAIDDFGTGYSSLNYLKKFSIDKLKIDKSFVDDCDTNNNDVAIIKTIIEMSKIFGLKVQAEGVEKKSQLDILEKLNCEYIQGYYCSKPLNEDNFIQLLEKNVKKYK